MTIRELRALLFEISDQDAKIKIWKSDDLEDLKGVLATPVGAPEDHAVALLLLYP